MWYCRVCGLAYDYSPWGEDERTPDYGICECCGVEFGYEDFTPESTRTYRQQWLAAGASWLQPKQRPVAWELATQLAQVSPAYR
ncbi:hypothetical protein DLM85_21280 [Hymenobacter edaphi]|uniref:Rubredoxin-like domain-containing protein n=1 Tax=Hymenobacter edaphi TaxID=2211146 RepID=A0A328BCE6_9BACT|nr:hypothetical protein DLM85_21280 [Hymenobacter edaphi]